MKTGSSRARPPGSSSGNALALKSALWLALLFVILAAILFLTSGRLDWGMAWLLPGALFACALVNLVVLMRVNPEVVEERLQRRKGVKRWDRVLVAIMAAFGLALLLVAGFDERFGWSPQMAPSLRTAGLAVFVLGNLLFLWAMAVNKFFSKLVRTQEERGHHVVTAGPYQHVRHPGYVGWILMTFSIPVILGSVWAVVPAGLATCVMLVRTVLEDRTLKEELDGYTDYAEQVRYRLLPGIW